MNGRQIEIRFDRDQSCDEDRDDNYYLDNHYRELGCAIPVVSLPNWSDTITRYPLETCNDDDLTALIRSLIDIIEKAQKEQ